MQQLIQDKKEQTLKFLNERIEVLTQYVKTMGEPFEGLDEDGEVVKHSGFTYEHKQAIWDEIQDLEIARSILRGF